MKAIEKNMDSLVNNQRFKAVKGKLRNFKNIIWSGSGITCIALVTRYAKVYALTVSSVLKVQRVNKFLSKISLSKHHIILGS